MSYTKTSIIAPDQVWTKEFLQEIKENQLVVYNDGVYGIKIHPQKNNTPLFEILSEDDGYLFSSENKNIFDIYWTDKLIDVLNMAKDYWEEIKDKYK